MSPPLQRLDATEFEGEDLPAWAEKLIDAHNKNVDAIKALSKAAPQTTERVLTFQTKTPAADTFDPPMRVASPFQPGMVKVTRVRNLTDVNAAQALTVSVDWVIAGVDGFYIRAMPGLDDGVTYQITLELSP